MYDAAIIGAGPAGLNAALTLGRARRTAIVCDSGSPRNATVEHAHGFLSRDGVPPSELRAIGREEVSRYGVEFRDLGVTAAERTDEGFTLTLTDGSTVTSRRVVLATGLVDELPEVDGLAAMWGRSAFNCPYCNGWELSDRPIAVLGGDAEAVVLALHMRRWSQDLVVCTDGPAKFDDTQRGQLAAAGVTIREDAIRRFDGVDGSLRAVEFSTGEELEREAVFLRTRTSQRSDIGKQLGCNHFDDGAVEVNDFQQTTVPGVFAVGDTARRASLPFAAAQLVIAAASGALAAVVIDLELLGAEVSSLTPPA
ncbi:MAG: NAD(P)/FAD-dependent oxidoreductase [Streptomyces sp.]|nr:NAD(P)/FAD-dependent oxidoreductase [Streptomyces sp.]